jgi:hypothetical protein
MAGDRKDPPDFPGLPFMLPGFPFSMLPVMPPDLWFQMWLHIVLGPYREFLEWYKQVLEEWNREDVDGSLRHLGNEVLYASLTALKTSREVRSKLTQLQIESIDNYLRILDRFASPGVHHRSS